MAAPEQQGVDGEKSSGLECENELSYRFNYIPCAMLCTDLPASALSAQVNVLEEYVSEEVY